MTDQNEVKGTLIDVYIDIDDDGHYQLHCLFDGDFTRKREQILRSLVQSRNITSIDRIPQGDARVSKVSRAFAQYNNKRNQEDERPVPKGAVVLSTAPKPRADYVSIVQMSMMQWLEDAEQDATMLAMLHDNIELRGFGRETALVWSFADEAFEWSGINLENINPSDDEVTETVVEEAYLPVKKDLTNQYEIRREMIQQLMEDFPLVGPRIFGIMVQATDHMRALGEVRTDADLMALESDELGFHLTPTGSDVAGRRKARASRKNRGRKKSGDADTSGGGKADEEGGSGGEQGS